MPAATPRILSLTMTIALAGGAAGGGWWLWNAADPPPNDKPAVHSEEAIAGNEARLSRKRSRSGDDPILQGGATDTPGDSLSSEATGGPRSLDVARTASGNPEEVPPTIRVADPGEELLPRDASGRAITVSQDERAPGLRPLTPTPAPETTPGQRTGDQGISGTNGGGDPRPAAPASEGEPNRHTTHPTIQRAIQIYESGRVIEARSELNQLLAAGMPEPDAATVRHWLARIADETIFSPTARGEDPLVESYTIRRGERLVGVARRFDVPPDFILHVNRLSSPNAIKAGQTLRIPRGPVNLRISRSQFRMDVYIGDVYVRSYPVALGAEPGTPLGVWRVGEKLVNPTYYPPPSAKDKRVIPGGRPDNPLGSHWIRIEGVEGEAVGKTGYGIHGTIEPDSIGKAASLGCVRMHNADVAVIYKMLLPGKSRVTIVE